MRVQKNSHIKWFHQVDGTQNNRFFWITNCKIINSNFLYFQDSGFYKCNLYDENH